MDKTQSPKKPRIRRPKKLDGDLAFLHVRVAARDKHAFIDFCRRHRVGGSQVIREAMQAVVTAAWTPPCLATERKVKKPSRVRSTRR